MNHKRYTFGNLQSGAVSIFSVVFAMLLITVVTVSFVRLMVRDQQQASAADLSQSAYDSALAGVEDAKRLLVFCQSADTSAYPACQELAAKTCAETLSAVKSSGTATPDENAVQSGADANDMQQAYTCLNIDPTPMNYVGQLAKDQSNVIPLVTTSGNRPAQVYIEWMTKADIGNSALVAPTVANLRSAGGSAGFLPDAAKWAESGWPAAIQLQRITNGASDPYDTTMAWNNQLELPNDLSQLLLLPTSSATATPAEKAFPTSRVGQYDSDDSVDIFGFATCRPSAGNDALEYYCSAVVPLSSSSSANTTLLRITSLYRGAHYRVTMQNNTGSNLPFKGVQAVVDATGRASDIFRRVEARVDLTPAAPYPDAAVETGDDLCKAFFVTSESYSDGGSCTP